MHNGPLLDFLQEVYYFVLDNDSNIQILNFIYFVFGIDKKFFL